MSQAVAIRIPLPSLAPLVTPGQVVAAPRADSPASSIHEFFSFVSWVPDADTCNIPGESLVTGPVTLWIRIMFNQLHRIVSNGRVWLSRNSTRKQLLAMGDDVLLDLGVSRKALLLGNGGFPWRAEMDGHPDRPVGLQARSGETSGRVVDLVPHAIAPVSVLSLTLASALLAPRAQQRKAA